MDLYTKEYEVTKPTIGLLAVKIKSAMGLPMNKYMLIQNQHQLRMVEEDRDRYKLFNLCLQTADEDVKMTSNGIVGQRIPVEFINKYLNSKREIKCVIGEVNNKGVIKIVHSETRYTLAQVNKLIQLRDEHIVNFLKGARKESPKEFVLNNLKNIL